MDARYGFENLEMLYTVDFRDIRNRDGIAVFGGSECLRKSAYGQQKNVAFSAWFVYEYLVSGSAL